MSNDDATTAPAAVAAAPKDLTDERFVEVFSRIEMLEEYSDVIRKAMKKLKRRIADLEEDIDDGDYEPRPQKRRRKTDVVDGAKTKSKKSKDDDESVSISLGSTEDDDDDDDDEEVEEDEAEAKVDVEN